ncbi:MAG: hypothetical protein EHM35_02995 [Planctomycetaceae bacterium]|nr:MAG: hypothetical protein EHM35_02995 [Planctomycetaceae bacterium]
MFLPYSDLRAFVQSLTPTWGKHQHEILARVALGLIARGNLKLTEIARELPRPDQPLHGRLKRLGRLLDNPRLDEAALFVRWFRLSYRFGEDLPQSASDSVDQRPILPMLLDTVYFEPFALLVSTVACGSRGLPIALTTYHRRDLCACFPPVATWPRACDQVIPPRPRRGRKRQPASAVPTEFASQNQIEEHLIDYTFALLSPALRGTTVADAGFARASLFRYHQARKWDFAIRFDAQTHIRLPEPLAPGLPVQGPPGQVLALQPGQRIWCPIAWYGKEEQVPISLLALWDVGYEKPWYIATSLETADLTETVYRWRMRLECANRDEKTGAILRESGDQHALTSVLHLHRLLLTLGCAEWFLALTGLQAWQDLPDGQPATSSAVPALARARPHCETTPLWPAYQLPSPDESASSEPTCPPTDATKRPWTDPSPRPTADRALSLGDLNNPDRLLSGPGFAPPIVAHRGARPKLPTWMKRFAARGPLSYVRLGLEVLRSPDLGWVARRMVRWLAAYLWPLTPLWRPWQLRYRFRRWWLDSS